jgi:hypothetical protein
MKPTPPWPPFLSICTPCTPPWPSFPSICTPPLLNPPPLSFASIWTPGRGYPSPVRLDLDARLSSTPCSLPNQHPPALVCLDRFGRQNSLRPLVFLLCHLSYIMSIIYFHCAHHNFRTISPRLLAVEPVRCTGLEGSQINYIQDVHRGS